MGHFRLRGRCAELGPREPRNETSPTVRHFVEIARVSGGSARGLPPARFKETFNDRDPLPSLRWSTGSVFRPASDLAAIEITRVEQRFREMVEREPVMRQQLLR